jgi:TrpR-related protein YerC/YecD
MSQDTTTVWKSSEAQQFVDALLSIRSESEMQYFLRDVMTEKEIIEISARLEAARLLQSGSTYTTIVAKTKLSSRTVARISEWMKNGCGGYAIVLSQTNSHHTHISPASAV